ncbi:alpha/beta hydrolase [Antrihabitans cavernicola]|uniref:Alpha/beta hydrolase n=2 Tax=Antrihabitans cavernicola TaxID=2495913 RepID=A0A5A7S9G1_9NOCA|nr:alpha/beta hydrolase [Spelaeibacter cavernicola]
MRNRTADPYEGEDFGLIDSDRGTEVRADDGVMLAVREAGPRDAPTTVLFVHGFSNRMTSFHLQRRDLHDRWGSSVRMVFVDLRGHGRSGTPSTESCTIEQLGRDIGTVIDALVPHGRIVLIGHSMGGMAVLSAARQRPDLFRQRVAGIGLVSSTAAGLASEGLGRNLRNPLLDGFAFAARSTPRLLEHSRVAAKTVIWPILHASSFRTRVSPTLVHFTNTMIDQTPVGTIGSFLRTLEVHDELAALPVLADIPVLVLSGSGDVVVPFSGAQRLATELPHSELVRVDGAGHMVHLEFPDLVNDAIDRLVQRSVDAQNHSVG